MKPAFDQLREQVLAADGSWGTQLWLRGVSTRAPVELANLNEPLLVSSLAAAYADAGARFITTNTFSANRLMLQRRGVDVDVAELNRTGARLAREAVADRAAVVGSIGPSGRILAVREAKEADLTAAFAEQAAALAAGGVDALVLETFSELAEILVALAAVRQATGLPVIASMSYDSGPQRTRTMMGAEAGGCARALQDAGADVVGMNCGRGMIDALPVVVALRAHCDKPLWVKPNAGLPELEDGKPVYTQTPEDFIEPLEQLIAAGASVIGGCCGTGPDHIRKLAQAVALRGLSRGGER